MGEHLPTSCRSRSSSFTLLCAIASSAPASFFDEDAIVPQESPAVLVEDESQIDNSEVFTQDSSEASGNACGWVHKAKGQKLINKCKSCYHDCKHRKNIGKKHKRRSCEKFQKFCAPKCPKHAPKARCYLVHKAKGPKLINKCKACFFDCKCKSRIGKRHKRRSCEKFQKFCSNGLAGIHKAAAARAARRKAAKAAAAKAAAAKEAAAKAAAAKAAAAKQAKVDEEQRGRKECIRACWSNIGAMTCVKKFGYNPTAYCSGSIRRAQEKCSPHNGNWRLGGPLSRKCPRSVHLRENCRAKHICRMKPAKYAHP